MKKEKVDKTVVFSKYSIPKAFVTLCVPTVISQIVMIIYNLADTVYLGRIGEQSEVAVAALGIVLPIFVIMMAIANLFGVGGASVIARFLGAKQPDKARSTFAFCFYGGLLGSIIYILILVIFHEPLIYLVGGSEETYDLVYRYMVITMMIGAIPTIMNAVLGHLVRSTGASIHASIGLMLGGVLNIILDPIFMFVLMKGHELEGAAIATALSNAISLIYFLVYLLLTKKNIYTYTLNIKDIKFKQGIGKEVILIGIPAALSTTLAMVSNIFANVLINTPVNISALAGLNVAKKANTIAFNILMGLTQGMLPFIAYNYASNDVARRRAGIKALYLVAGLFGTFMMIFYLVFTKFIITAFIPGNDVAIDYGVDFLHGLALAVPLCALTFSTSTIFQAIGKKSYSLILSILRKGLLDIPLMYTFKYLIGFGITGVILATPVAEMLSVGVAAFLLFKARKLIDSKARMINEKNEKEELSNE